MHPVVRVVSQPPYEPVSLVTAKAWLKLDHSDEDAIVRGLVKAMRERAESITGRDFVQRTRRLYLSDWPRHCEYAALIKLPTPPLVSVTAFQYVDTDGVTQTLATDQYVVHTERELGIVVPAWQVTWPTIRRLPDAVQVTYKSGYAPGSPDDEAGYQEHIPQAVKTWMEMNIAALFDQRGIIVVGTSVVELPRTVGDSLLDDLVVGSRLF